ncbi:MAG: CocE/NonD family hydrolase, partial [Gemmatimonadetes bacterium]|nr:CocE/NonD family hydrolase [Gemmatimonadota bacterium]
MAGRSHQTVPTARTGLMDLLVLLVGAAASVTATPTSAQVTVRFGVETPMRDGTVLVSDMWMPEGDGPFPTILVRIPYERTLQVVPANLPPVMGHYFAEHGYVWIAQDTRGRGDSGGTFTFFQ